jgi:Tfp pilus assembly protein FimT
LINLLITMAILTILWMVAMWALLWVADRMRR